MNTKIILGVIVVAIACGAFFYFKKVDAPSVAPATVEAPAEEKQAPRSLRDLLALGQSQKCTFTSTVENSTNTGTVYISGNNMRGDFISQVSGPSGAKIASHMINDGKEMRMWTDGETMGFLMDVSAEGSTSDSDTTTSNTEYQTPIDLDDTETDYRCESWSVNASFFVPPTNVTFHSMADMMQGMTIPMGAGSAGSDAGMGAGMEAGGQ